MRAATAPAPDAALASLATLADLFSWRAACTPSATAYLEADPEGRWQAVSWQAVAERVERLGRALSRSGLAPHARVAILLPNGLNAVCIDQATLARGCVPVPLHAIDNPASIAYILSDSDASLLIAGSDAQWNAIAAVGLPLPALREVIVIRRESEAGAAMAGPVVRTLAEWSATTSGRPADGDAEPADDSPAQRPDAEDLAALVYTSGTTGRPKGVMLTHGNVLSNVKATLQRVAPAPGDVFLSFLPLSHTFERTAGYYAPIAAGCCVAFARSVDKLAEDLKTVRPTILVSVPRIYERVFAKVQAALAGSVLKRRMFEIAWQVGWRRFCRAQRLAVEAAGPAWLDALAWPVLDRLIAQPLRAQFGGRLRLAVSGGAPLSPTIAHCFLGLGVPLMQGYGMTETSPVVAANAPGDNDPSTVGRPLAGVEVRIGANQELQVRGANVMRGYWKRDVDSTRAFVDGWLRTGDQAVIEDGRIRILGRLKEIIVTSTGEKIAPADLELAIAADPLFEQAFVVGDDRPFIAAVVVFNRPAWERLAAELGLDAKAPASLQSPAVRDAALQRIRALTGAFPYYAQPRAVVPTLEPWTVENTLITPTLKLKRNNLAARFAPQIEHLYAR